jgi:hypothetical protein
MTTSFWFNIFFQKNTTLRSSQYFWTLRNHPLKILKKVITQSQLAVWRRTYHNEKTYVGALSLII